MTRAVLVAMVMAGEAGAQPPGVDLQLAREPTGRRFELALAPAMVQLNGKFTQHVGTLAAFTWRVRERFALQVLGGANWLSEESRFGAQLADYRVEVQPSSTLLWTWGLFGGTEVEPLFGEFTALDGPRWRVGFLLSAGMGVGGTRHQLGAMSSGDTGTRFMGTIAAGLRVRMGSRFTARVELRDVGFSSSITTVNGCDVFDLEALDARVRMGRDPQGATVSGTCAGFSGPGDVPHALWLVKYSGTDVLHLLGLSVSAGVVF